MSPPASLPHFSAPLHSNYSSKDCYASSFYPLSFLDPLQSRVHSPHATEVALVQFTNDIYPAKSTAIPCSLHLTPGHSNGIETPSVWATTTLPFLSLLPASPAAPHDLFFVVIPLLCQLSKYWKILWLCLGSSLSSFFSG